MKLIVGLGNPGEKYEHTRHNLGFMVIDKFLKDYSRVEESNWKNEAKFKGEIAEITRESSSDKILLIRPLTFMNLSGESVFLAASFYKILPQDIWVIHDDIDLGLGTLRIKNGGASAGHRGIESIIQALGTDKFWRFRLGVGNPINKSKVKSQKSKIVPVDEYVLKKFARGESGELRRIIKKAAISIKTGLEEGLEIAMNKFNTK